MKRVLVFVLLAFLLSGCSLMKMEKINSSNTEAEDAEAASTVEESTEDKGVEQDQKTEGNEEAKDDSPKKASMAPADEFTRFIEEDMSDISVMEYNVQVNLSQAQREPAEDKDQAMKDALERAIAGYEQLSMKMEAIEVESDELVKLKQEALEGFRIYQEYLILNRELIDDPSKDEEMIAKNLEYQRAKGTYQSHLEDLADKYGYSFEQ
ncbi:hypothetical protein M1I95_17145 [Rossellomorea marisflavi]|uniref:hypothetical protein n=1 Tax=Rossellomorea marisflavi TaxID=189381 RepID=UPI00279F3D67|nr:hypothetical protein [Rossellomorea marisflavi]UTE71975.1 hypothetical protein M1I95_17145 [Rossellomorea marisflavi]